LASVAVSRQVKNPRKHNLCHADLSQSLSHCLGHSADELALIEALLDALALALTDLVALVTSDAAVAGAALRADDWAMTVVG
jgi:hypothetical protein